MRFLFGLWRGSEQKFGTCNILSMVSKSIDITLDFGELGCKKS